MKTLRLSNAATDIRRAADLLIKGGLVALPTETVYGLAADALNPEAAARIYEAKGRPSDNPLILHVANARMADQVAYTDHPLFEELTNAFWPGPLTLVLPKKADVPLATTGGLNTVAVRMPDHAVMQQVIALTNKPLAAPSANSSGKPSPTSAQHVLEDLDGIIDAVLDDGPCRIGVESTVVDLTGEAPIILRPGSITEEMIVAVVGPLQDVAGERVKHSPGTRYKHYSPKAHVAIANPEASTFFREPFAWIGSHSHPKAARSFILSNAHEYARDFYAILRECDRLNIPYIYVEPVEEIGVGKAVMDRVRRAAGIS
ncbi:MAG: hypothetical protein RL226_1481 [Bacteroidota bacterium]